MEQRAPPEDDGSFVMLDNRPQEFVPDWFSKPADSLLGLMRRRDISVESVSEVIGGGMDTLRALMGGVQEVDPVLARELSKAVGGSSEFWLKRQANYDRALDLASNKALDELDEWLEFVPAPGGKARGRLSETRKLTELRRRLAFYGVSNLRAWNSRYGQMRDETQFRTSQAFYSKAGPVSLWLRQGELEAALTSTGRWDPERLRELLGDILKLSKIRQPNRFLPRLKAMASEAGVAIGALRAPKGCKASGASRLVNPEKAMVLLSFRHLSDDHFWFTVLHEFGHLLLHDANTFVDADDTYLDDCEREANEFASSCIIPASRWEEFSNLQYDRNSILRFSVSLGIAPGLVVGQLQHRGAIPRDRLNFLKRRWTWDEIETALG